MALIRPATAEDEAGILRLFAIVFQSEMSPAVWRWKYLHDGSSPPAFIAEEDGKIVCHYGTIRQRVYWQGQEHYAWDAIDVMAHPRQQGRGLFRRTVQAFMQESCEGQGLFLYGFPTERHKRLGEWLVGYEPVARVHHVSKALSTTAPVSRRDDVVTDVLPLNWDTHWHQLETSFDLVTRRDRAYLHWRYRARPDRQYRLVTIPAAPAMAVIGIQPGRALLMEFLVDRTETLLARALLAGVEAVACTEAVESIEGWFPPFSWQERFLCEVGGFSAAEIDNWLECRLFNRQLTAAWLAEHFFYSLGDFDVY